MREGMAAAPEFACADMTFDVSGEIDHYGNIVSDVDMEQIERCLCSMRGKVDRSGSFRIYVCKKSIS